MTNIEAKAKANELYPPVKDMLGGDLNEFKRDLWIKGAEWLLSTLSGTPEAEEVLKPYLEQTMYKDGTPAYEILTKEDALKAMQKYAASRVARQYMYIAKLEHENNDLECSVMTVKREIQSLQQSNQRLTAEVERLNNMITEKNSELYFSDHTNELKEALEQCMARINPNSKDTWDLKALYVAKKALNPLP